MNWDMPQQGRWQKRLYQALPEGTEGRIHPVPLNGLGHGFAPEVMRSGILAFVFHKYCLSQLPASQ